MHFLKATFSIFRADSKAEKMTFLFQLTETFSAVHVLIVLFHVSCLCFDD